MESNITVSYDFYRSALKDNEDLREKLKELQEELQQSKSDHTMDKARVVYAYHILNAGRDEHVLLHMDDKEKINVFYKMKYEQALSEIEHYKKSVNAWIDKHDKLFKKHQEALGAIRELEDEVDRYHCKRCCK